MRYNHMYPTQRVQRILTISSDSGRTCVREHGYVYMCVYVRMCVCVCAYVCV